jgi:tetratricopeptide (TPR) repeat protein
MVRSSSLQYDKARQVWTSVLERYPESARANFGLAMLDILDSKYERAINEAEEAVRISDESFFREFLGWTYAAAGHRQEAADVLQGLLEGRYKGYASHVGISAIYFALGDYEKGFEWLQRGFQEHSASLPMMHNWPTFDAPRKDPRFKELLQKANFPIS